MLREEFEADVVEAEKPEYAQELPPTLVPRSKIELASVKEHLAELELLLSPGWLGDPRDAIAKAGLAQKSGSAAHMKLTKRLRDASLELERERSLTKEIE